MKTTRLVLMSLMLPALAACGVKGPLVLPDGEKSSAPAVEPVELPRDADATRSEDASATAEPADAAEPAAPPTDE